ncbi:unnamed protein product [Gulo gulo]|uniref:Secreted protein n=1 Tax=Gulo gulo TaxID=48420 RepID=A0A9X9Q5I0_GULGU|nr:unnamed protein product [Gulo gulo]
MAQHLLSVMVKCFLTSRALTVWEIRSEFVNSQLLLGKANHDRGPSRKEFPIFTYSALIFSFMSCIFRHREQDRKKKSANRHWRHKPVVFSCLLVRITILSFSVINTNL